MKKKWERPMLKSIKLPSRAVLMHTQRVVIIETKKHRYALAEDDRGPGLRLYRLVPLAQRIEEKP